MLLLFVRLSPRLPEGGDTTATVVPGIVLNTYRPVTVFSKSELCRCVSATAVRVGTQKAFGSQAIAVCQGPSPGMSVWLWGPGTFVLSVVGFLEARSKGLGCSRQPVRWWCSWIERWHSAQPPWVPRGSHLAGVVWGLCRGGGRGWGLPEEACLSVPDMLLAWNHVHSMHSEKPFLKSTTLTGLGTGVSSDKDAEGIQGQDLLHWSLRPGTQQALCGQA